jgi:tripartite-type tricarboxylate transporter receptor subunit TctC
MTPARRRFVAFARLLRRAGQDDRRRARPRLRAGRETCGQAPDRIGTGIRLLAAAALCASAAAAAQPYPSKPIRFIIPFAPGGGNDIIGRVVAQRLSEVWSQSVVVDNRGGAGSSLGTAVAAKSPPDGYTLLLTSIAIAFNANLYRNLPYDVTKDLAAVSRIATQPSLLVVHAKVPARSVRELVDLARAKPGALTFASAGMGSGVHFAGEIFRLSAGIDIRHVPYKGTGPALNDLLGGQVDLMMSTMASALPHVANGRLRGLGISSPRRSPAAPDIPTIAESGLPGFEYATWYGLHVPAGTPRPIVTAINAAVGRVVTAPDVRERFAAAGVDPESSTPEAFAAFCKAEVTRWADVVRRAGVKVE